MASGFEYRSEPLFADDKRSLRRKCVICTVVLIACCCVSICANPQVHTFHTPSETVQAIASWFQLAFTRLASPQDVADLRLDVLASSPDYEAVMLQIRLTAKFALCGVLLAVSGMLYQNAFRNPIAAPSMLGVTNGISFAVLVLVMQFGWASLQHIDLYYLYSYVGGAVVLLLVMAGGKWTSRKGGFNVVNMILVGTIASQLVGVVMTFVQNFYFSDNDWQVYNQLVQAFDIESVWTYVSLAIGTLAAFVPILLFRFRLNLVSFSDEETRLLGVDPTRLRLLALGCGSIMILTAQVNAGQVAMLSLVVPFVSRAVFGSEFRKQLAGNILLGATMLVVCGLVSQYVIIDNIPVGLAGVTTFIAMPLFVWMIAIRQRSWD